MRVQAMSRAIGRTNGKRVPRRAYVFEAAVYDGCPLRPQCVNRTCYPLAAARGPDPSVPASCRTRALAVCCRAHHP